MSEESSPLANFAGVARLFPLPNLVFFPHVMQPLHIFEPRYRRMTADALDSDGLIALAMLQPDWEKDYEGKPAIYPVACLGKIIADQRFEDGRYNLLLRGLKRIRILRELTDDKPYRQGEVALLSDIEVPKAARPELRRRLGEAVNAWFPKQGGLYTQLTKVLESELPLGALVDILTFALPLSVELKQQQLEDIHVERRVARLLEQPPAETAAAALERAFPPDFSAN